MLENPNAVANVVSSVDLSCFDQRWVLGAQIGRDTSSNFALSFSGLAVRTQDNRFVVPQLEGATVKLLDVTCLTIAADPYAFRIPVPIDDVEPGDLLVRSDAPFSLLFVEENPRDGRIRGIDPRSDEAVEIVIPEKSLDMPTLLVRVVSVYDGFGGGGGGGLAEGGEDGGTDFGGMMPFLFAGGLGGGVASGAGNNAALLALAMSRSRRFDSRLAFLLLAGGTQSNALTQLFVLSALSGRQGPFGSRRGRKREAAQPAPEPKPRRGGGGGNAPPQE